MRLTYRMRGVISMAAIIGVGVGSWVICKRGEKDRQAAFEKYMRTHPAEMAFINENNAILGKMLREAMETSDNVARRPFPWKK